MQDLTCTQRVNLIGLLIFLWSQTGIQTEEVREPGLTEGIDKKAIEVKFITKQIQLYMGGS